jgi:hypothetical protein
LTFSNARRAHASFSVTQTPSPTVRDVASISAAILLAGLAAAYFAGALAFAMSLAFARVHEAGLGAIALIVVLAIPVLAVITVVGPFAAGMAGGFAGSRPIAAIGSVAGLLVGYGIGFNVLADPDVGASLEGLVAAAAILIVMTLIGHFTALGLRRSGLA